MSAHSVPVWINQVSINTGDGTDGFTPEETSAGALLQGVRRGEHRLGLVDVSRGHHERHAPRRLHPR